MSVRHVRHLLNDAESRHEDYFVVTPLTTAFTRLPESTNAYGGSRQTPEWLVVYATKATPGHLYSFYAEGQAAGTPLLLAE